MGNNTRNFKTIVFVVLCFRLSWFIIYAGTILLVTIIVTILARLIGLFQNSNMFLFFMMLFLYGLSIINLAFMLTPFFNKTQVQAYTGLSKETFGGIISLYSLYASTKIRDIFFEKC